MGIEILLYGCGIICLSMILFNLIYTAVMRSGDKRHEGRVRRLENALLPLVGDIYRGKEPGKSYLKKLTRRLSRTKWLTAMDSVMSRHPSVFDPCLSELAPMFTELARIYDEKGNLQSAYFAYFIGRHPLPRSAPTDGIKSTLVRFMNKSSLYCRVNALHALYAFGDAEAVVNAVCLLDRTGSFIHEKILQDGLLTFSGDRRALVAGLWSKFDGLSEKTQVAIINYIRYSSGDYGEKMLELMTCANRSKELRLAAIRYFGKYRYGPAVTPLVNFTADKDPVNWEYAAIAASSLANYRGDGVTAALTDALHSPNWYVRGNAASSLTAQGLKAEDIAAAAGDDRYAREMLSYRVESAQQGKETVR